MKIVIDSAIPYIQDRWPDGKVNLVSLPAREITSDVVKEADALFVRTRTKCDANLLEGSNVKFIGTATIGTDHIDLPWCEKNSIKVQNAPGCNASGVAQYVFSSLFNSGFDPMKHTLGIIGYGNVGSIVEEWAEKLGVKTLICDPPRKEAGYRDKYYIEMWELLQNSHAVTLHVPFTKTGNYPTFHLLGKKHFEMMKADAILVNSSRGGVVDETAWKTAIKNKRIKAIVDVWENEPIIDRELLNMSTVATPHIAGYSEEGKRRATKMVLEGFSKEFNMPVDLSGLLCNVPPGKEISRELIENSYDSTIDSQRLKNNPEAFEDFRNNYQFRHEPLFT